MSKGREKGGREEANEGRREEEMEMEWKKWKWRERYRQEGIDQ